MEAILLMGIQATGKSSFYKAHFADTHVRINLDMLKTRRREQKLFTCCLEIKQPFVIDNTNLNRKERLRYLPEIQQHDIDIHGYYFASNLRAALARNAQRGARAIPEKGVLSAYKRLELPTYDEGFTTLSYVTLVDGAFEIKEWRP